LASPTNDSDAATKGYVDALAQGIDAKASVVAATTANITLSGAQTIDGISIIAGDRVLVKDQSTASQNGIYLCATGSWTRTTDADTYAELVAAFTFVEKGTTNADSGFICTIDAGGTLGSTSITWAQFSGAGQITAGDGLTKTGNTLNVGTASSSRIVVNGDNIDLASSGVTPGTYQSVTFDTYGRATAGTNPTTIAGYNITNAYTKTEIDSIFGSTTAAATSASNAATSASSAATSASNASTSETNAAASATSAAASYDSFDDRYLGPKATAPTVDNDGNALLTGALYWNTAVSTLYVWTGSAWTQAAFTASGFATLTGTETLTNKTLTSPILTTPQLGTPSSGTLTNATGLPLTTGVTGTLPVANGGTGAATLTANNVLLGNGTSALQAVAPSTAGNILTSNGTTWVSSTPAGGSTADLQTFTSSGTWTKPSGVTFVRVCVWGGGGGGGSGRFTTAAQDTAGGAGGGGGARASAIFPAACLPSTVTVTIGAGGAGGAARTSASSGANGSVGGTSTFGTGCGYIKAFGGGGGSLGACDAVNYYGGGGGGTGGAGGIGSSSTAATGGFPRSNYNGVVVASSCLRANAIGGGGGAGGGINACIRTAAGNAEWGGAGGGAAGRPNVSTVYSGGGSLFGGTGGGGGGWTNASFNAGCGGEGGSNKYSAGGGAAGGSCSAGTAGSILPSGSGGGGGGGSGCRSVGSGLAGGAGSVYGGGGGGGAGGRVTTSGAGGAGGSGGIKVYSW
jgi:hypothetical protein